MWLKLIPSLTDKYFVRLFLILIFTQSLIFAQSDTECENLFNWIYKDITLNNMSESVDVIKAKTMLAVITSLDNSQKIRLSKNQELLKHYKSLANNSELFLQMTANYRPLNRYKFWRPFSYKKVKTLNFEQALHSWSKLQKENPKLFKGLDKKYLINDWDLIAVQKLNKLDAFSEVESELAKELNLVLSKIKKETEYDITINNIHSLRSRVNQMQKNIYNNIKDSYDKYISEFSSLCDDSQEVYKKHMNKCNLINTSSLTVNEKLNKFSDLFNSIAVMKSQKPQNREPSVVTPPKVDPLADLIINKVNYKTSKNKNATYCIRDKKALSGITIHHTATPPSWSPQDINKFHLNRSTAGDPWYMIGYHYLVNSKSTTVSEARPLDYSGAHAGGYDAPLDSVEYDRIKDLKVTCAHTKKQHKKQRPHPLSDDFNSNGQAKGNVTTVGVALIGNFETKYKSTVSGVTLIKNPSKIIKRASPEAIIKVAKLACKLQKENPTIKVIRPHSYYHSTNCPGSVIADLNKVSSLASEYGCSFDVEYTK